MSESPRRMTVGELRRALAKEKIGWTVHSRFRDREPIPRYTTGGVPGEVRASRARTLDFREVLKRGTPNRWLQEQHVVRGFLAEEMAPARPVLPHTAAGPGPVRAVDWRNRWGWPWITTARDQNPCYNCWAFASAALVESMTRIEHAAWSPRSEGDLLNSVNATCNNSGNWTMGLNGIEQRGLADRDCVPWVPMVTTYIPTADRDGRTVRIGDWKYVENVEDQKDWLENVGPLVTSFYVWNDFFAYGGTDVYRKSATLKPVTDEAGWHALLIVGFDDARKAWIVKNSWGSAWGDNGFGLIGYGECEIDRDAKAGVQGTDPDPWTKRRLHNGNILEGDLGANHNDFEMLAAFNGGSMRHWRRANAGGQTWQGLETFANDVELFRPSLIQSTYNRNFEAVYLTNHRLRHWWFSRNAQRWLDGGIFGPPNAAGIPALIQSNYGAPGNLEVVVRTADGRLSQWWRENGSGGGWVDGGKFASGVAFSGASLIQSGYGQKGDFFLVCTLDSGEMQEWRRDNDNHTGWQAGPKFGGGIVSPPCMIEGPYGAATESHVGNFELCVAANGQVQHWWRANWTDGTWRFGGSFGHDVFAVTGLLQSSFGFALEVVVLRYDFSLQHYWRSVSGWHEGPIIGNAA